MTKPNGHTFPCCDSNGLTWTDWQDITPGIYDGLAPKRRTHYAPVYSPASFDVVSYCHVGPPVAVPNMRCEILQLDDENIRAIRAGGQVEFNDPRPVLTLADGTTVRADEMWENRALSGHCVGVAWANTSGGSYVRHEREIFWRGGARTAPFRDVDFSGWDCVRRVYPPPADDRTAIIREELADQARRSMLRESIARLRPGDEIEITHAGRRTWARVTEIHRTFNPRLPVLRVVGRTTFGMIVTAHEHWVTDVRPETNEGVRASWVARHA